MAEARRIEGESEREGGEELAKEAKGGEWEEERRAKKGWRGGDG